MEFFMTFFANFFSFPALARRMTQSTTPSLSIHYLKRNAAGQNVNIKWLLGATTSGNFINLLHSEMICGVTPSSSKVRTSIQLSFTRHELTQAFYLSPLEANAISVELRKRVTFQFTLLTDTPYSPLPRELQHQLVASSPSSSSAHRISDWSDSCRRTIVAVEVQDSQNGAVHYWSLTKLRQRLELMREMCRNEAEKSPAQSPGSTSVVATQNQSVDNSTISGNDPFYDRFPWFRLVGRAFVLLGSLLYPVPLVHNVPIVNEKGDVRGYLRVAVQAVLEDENGDYSSGVKQSARISFTAESREKIQHFSSYSESQQPTPAEEEEEEGRVVEGHGSGRGGDSSSSESNHDEQSKTDEEKDKESILADHLTHGKDFTFRITILHALNIPIEYSDIFCQFHFVHHQDEAFSTEPIRNNSANRGANNTGAPLSFYHVQNITVKVTKSFVDYLRTQPLVLEVYGHLQQSLVRDRANPVAVQSANRLPPKRMLPPLLPVSQPLRSTKFGMLPPSPTSQVR